MTPLVQDQNGPTHTAMNGDANGATTSRSTTPSSLRLKRLHSSSISSRHSVHFDDDAQPKPGLRNPLPLSSSPTSATPSHSSPISKHFPSSPLSNTFAPRFNGDYRSPPLPNGPIPDRRTVSEAIPAATRSLIAHGKKPSRVTGGYETSSDEDPVDISANDADIGTPETPGTPSAFDSLNSAGPSRRRANSLLSPVDAKRTRRTRTSNRSTLHEPHSRLPSSKSESFAPTTTDKGKEKQKASKLASSLGLDAGPGDVYLSPEQLQNLFNDSDLASALRLLQTPHINSPRPPTFFDPPSPAPTTTTTTPFLATAPPALTDHTRDRTESVSSVAPHVASTWTSRPRADSETASEAFATTRRRASSKAGLIPDGQGGHVPFTHHVPVMQIDEETEEETVSRTISPTPEPPLPSETKKHGRLSKVFHLGKNKMLSERRKSNDSESAHSQPVEDHAREKAQYERDLEMRRREQKRREEELAQEQRFRALTQVAAHPSAERAAYRTGSHLRAFYQHIYEGIDDPPRLNPLAVLRWRRKTDEQDDNRRRWEVDHDVRDWPVSPRSAGSKISRPSLESTTHQSPRKKKDGSARGWQYTLDDIIAYKASQGVVNYFIPPRTFPDVQVMSDSDSEKKGGSSIAESSRRAVSVGSTSNASLGAAPPSRSTSIETGREKPREHRLTHRTHQSLSAVGPTAIGNALKQPFEKLSHAARKQRTMPILSLAGTDAEVEHDEAPNQPLQIHPRTPVKPIPPPPRQREPNFFRRHQDNFTDDEGHLRKLFLKGQRVFALDDARASKRSELGKPQMQSNREAELLALESALAREALFRETQAAAKKTQLELEAQERIKRLEQEIYADRASRLHAAKQKRDAFDVDLIDESIGQYLGQIDFLDQEARIGSQVEVEWSLADSLRNTYRSHEEHARDPPLPFESGSDIRRQASSPRRDTSTGPRRKRSLSLSIVTPPVISLSMRHRPRRTYLDPSGTNRVDPIKQAELVIAFTASKIRDLGTEREDLREELQKMVASIEAMIRQKEVVRHWARDTLERNTARRTTLNQLIEQEKSSGLTYFKQQRDIYVNSAAYLLFGAFRMIFWIYGQARSELPLYLKPFRLSTYCRSTRKTNAEIDANVAETRLQRLGDEDDVLVLPHLGERKRVPVLGILSVVVIGVAIGFYVYGQ